MVERDKPVDGMPQTHRGRKMTHIPHTTLWGAAASKPSPPLATLPAARPIDFYAQDHRDALACHVYKAIVDVALLALKVAVVGVVLPLALAAGCEAKHAIRGDARPAWAMK